MSESPARTSAPAGHGPEVLTAAAALLALSGATALAWEIVWFKRFSQLWGSSALALASTVGAYLFGLGAGAWLFGRVADRTRSPLKVYALCEIGIGVLALAVPWAIGQLFGLAAPLHAALGERPLLLAAARFATTLGVLGPPCVLMGGALPLLVAQLTTRRRSVGVSTAWLYAANALGAAGGAWLTGFHFLPAVGLLATSNVAVAVNLMVGFAALALARSAAEGEPKPRAGIRERRPARAVYVAAALTGCGALVLQMLWARQVALVLGGSTYTYTATLAIFVLGVGAGSLLFRLLLAKDVTSQVAVALGTALVVVPTLLGLALAPRLAEVAGEVRWLRSDAGFDAALTALVALALEGAPTLGMGLLFPALVQLAGTRGAAGRAVGSLYAANTVGALIGATITCALLLPAAGSFLSFRAVLAAYAVALAILFPPLRLPVHRPSLVALAACALALTVTWTRPDPRQLNLGRFLYGNEAFVEQSALDLAFAREGSTANVVVLAEPAEAATTTPRRILYLDGRVDGSNGRDMPMQLGLAYFPRLMHPAARNVLVIGLGTGSTAGASLLFEDTSVTCCEVEPLLAEASRRFEGVNHRPFESPRFTFVGDDGRGHVQGSEARYDLILSEPSSPWLAGASSLYTREFYEAAAARLKPGGMLAQWLQAYELTPEQYAMVVRTVTSVFPDAVLVRVSETETLVIAGALGVVPTGAELDAAQRLVDGREAIARDLARYFGTSDVRSLLLGHLYLAKGGLARLTGGIGDGGIVTDLNLRLEFEAPRSLFAGPTATGLLILRSADPAFHQRLFLDWGCGAGQLEALRRLKDVMFQADLPVHAAALVELALAYAPDDPELVVDRLLFGPHVEQLEFQRTVLRLLEQSPLEGYRLGRSLAQLGRLEPARAVLERLTETLPDSATAWSSLAALYASLEREEDARAALERAAGLDPMNDLTRGMLQALDEAE